VSFGTAGARVTILPMTANGAPGDAANGAGAADATFPPLRTFEVADGIVVVVGGRQYHVALPRYETADAVRGGGNGSVPAPMNGRIVAIFVTQGEQVAAGARLAAMEAMKMEHNLTAPIAGTVAEILTAPGAQVAEGAVLLRIEAEEQKPGP
jgi:3-methylcrotonyl-CoA carboxylase alpha subunit